MDGSDPLHYFAARCRHCFRPITGFATAEQPLTYCDELCARADVALERRMREAAAHARAASARSSVGSRDLELRRVP